MGTGRKRILIADDHAEMLEEVRLILKEDYEIVATASDGGALLEAAVRLKPDVIVSDISMPVMTGFEAAARMREAKVTSRLIFLTVQSSSSYVKKARSLGANGYVLKVYAREQLPAAVAVVLEGKSYFSPQLDKKDKGAAEVNR